MQENSISIIIVNHKSEKYLKGCIESIFKKFDKNLIFEIIVVSNDGESINDEIKEYSSRIKIINCAENKGFGAANNLGSKKANGELLFFLNPDTKMLSENISEIIKGFSDNNVGIIGLGLVTPEKNIQKWSAGNEVNLFSVIKNNLFFTKDRIIEEELKKEVSWVSGAAFIIKNSFFSELSGFDEDYFMYFEDVDLCQRVKIVGKKVIFDPSFKVLHYGGGSFSDKKAQKKEYYLSQDRYFRKYRGSIETFFLKLIRFFSL